MCMVHMYMVCLYMHVQVNTMHNVHVHVYCTYTNAHCTYSICMYMYMYTYVHWFVWVILTEPTENLSYWMYIFVHVQVHEINFLGRHCLGIYAEHVLCCLSCHKCMVIHVCTLYSHHLCYSSGDIHVRVYWHSCQPFDSIIYYTCTHVYRDTGTHTQYMHVLTLDFIPCTAFETFSLTSSVLHTGRMHRTI